MKSEHVAAILIEGCKTVGVKFYIGGGRDQDVHGDYMSKEYTYKTMHVLSEGDLVVVPTGPNFKMGTVGTVHIVPQIDVTSSNKLKWVVQKVDMEGYEKLVTVEKEFKDELLKLGHENVRARANELLIEKYGDGEGYKKLKHIIRSIAAPSE